jgi:Flp pilus assembly pilin Flp
MAEHGTPATRRFQGEDGANLVEYALLVSLIVLVCASAVGYFQDETTETFVSSCQAIDESDGGGGNCP